MVRRKRTRRKSKLPKIKLPNININIDGRKATLKTKNGKTTAKYGDYKGSVSQNRNRVNINLKKKKKSFLEEIF